MPRLKVVTAVGDRTRVFFGAWVGLQDEDGVEHTYRIVGADELDPAKGTISLDSPLAKRLLKAEVGDEIAHRVGDTVRHYEVAAIRYAGDRGLSRSAEPCCCWSTPCTTRRPSSCTPRCSGAGRSCRLATASCP